MRFQNATAVRELRLLPIGIVISSMMLIAGCQAYSSAIPNPASSVRSDAGSEDLKQKKQSSFGMGFYPSGVPRKNSINSGGSFTHAPLMSEVSNVAFVDSVGYRTLVRAVAACGNASPCWIVDTIPETFNVNPLAKYNGPGLLVEFGPGKWIVNSQITLPNSVIFEGAGRGSVTARAGTVFAAGPSFPSDTYIFRLGNGSAAVFGTRLENLGVDCESRTGCGGIYTTDANEESGARDVSIDNVNSNGILCDYSSGSQTGCENSSWEDIEVFGSANAAPGTVNGIFVRGTTDCTAVAIGCEGPKFIREITANGLGSVPLANSILLENTFGTTLAGIHGELTINVLHIGDSQGPAQAIQATGILGGTSGANVVLIQNPHTTAINVQSVQGFSFRNLINDAVNNIELSRADLGKDFCQGYSVGVTASNGLIVSRRVATGVVTMPVQPIAPNSCSSSVGVLASGVTDGDVISWSYGQSIGANPGILIVNDWAAAGNVNFNYCNPTASTVTPDATKINWTVVR